MPLLGFPRIVIDAEVCGGHAIVAGTRMRAVDILETLAAGTTPAEIVADFPYIGEEDVFAVLAYAAAVVGSRRDIDGNWIGPHDAPEWTDEMCDIAEHAVGGKVIRAATGYLGANGVIRGDRPERKAVRKGDAAAPSGRG